MRLDRNRQQENSTIPFLSLSLCSDARTFFAAVNRHVKNGAHALDEARICCRSTAAGEGQGGTFAPPLVHSPPEIVIADICFPVPDLYLNVTLNPNRGRGQI